MLLNPQLRQALLSPCPDLVANKVSLQTFFMTLVGRTEDAVSVGRGEAAVVYAISVTEFRRDMYSLETKDCRIDFFCLFHYLQLAVSETF